MICNKQEKKNFVDFCLIKNRSSRNILQGDILSYSITNGKEERNIMYRISKHTILKTIRI